MPTLSESVRRVVAFRRASRERHPHVHVTISVVAALTFAVLAIGAGRSAAQTVEPETPRVSIPALPAAVPTDVGVQVPDIAVPEIDRPGQPAGTAAGNGSVTLDVGDLEATPNRSVLILVGLTLLSLAPSLLIMMTSFTRIIIVLSLSRNALGLPSIPPNQVLVGMALFLSLFVMSPTLSAMNEVGLQPLLNGEKSQTEAISDAMVPLKSFMLANTRTAELNMLISATDQESPDRPEDTPMPTLIPAFILSEIKTAFIIGFVVFIPFLVIDLVVSAILMALGMMMLPPALVALPFKLLLFVLVDGWSLVVQSLLNGFRQ